MGFQKIEILGYVGEGVREIPSKTGENGVSFSVAVTRPVNGVRETVWFNVTAWKKTADIVRKMVHKGSLVIVSGTLNYDASTGNPRIWTDKNGNARARFDVFCSEIHVMNKEPSPQEETVKDTVPAEPTQGTLDDIECPF